MNIYLFKPLTVNPRNIRKKDMDKLKKSIQDSPEFMELKPIIIDENNMVLAGNQRLRALIELSYKEVPKEWYKKVTGWSKEKKEEFIIKDNTHYGDWDWDILANEWDEIPYSDWGLKQQFFEDIEETQKKIKEEKFQLLLDFESPEKRIEAANKLKKEYKLKVL